MEVGKESGPQYLIGNITLKQALIYLSIGIVLFLLTVKIVQGTYQIRPGEATAIQTFGAARDEPETQEQTIAKSNSRQDPNRKSPKTVKPIHNSIKTGRPSHHGP